MSPSAKADDSRTAANFVVEGFGQRRHGGFRRGTDAAERASAAASRTFSSASF